MSRPTLTELENERVGRDEPHWYAYVIDEGCVLCGRGGGITRMRVRGEAPKDPAERYYNEGPPAGYACGSHFA